MDKATSHDAEIYIYISNKEPHYSVYQCPLVVSAFGSAVGSKNTAIYTATGGNEMYNMCLCQNDKQSTIRLEAAFKTSTIWTIVCFVRRSVTRNLNDHA